MKVLFVNDSTSNPNWGDRAAAIALRRMIIASGGIITKQIYEEELFGDFFSNKSINKETVRRGVLSKVGKLCLPPLLLKAREQLQSFHAHSAVGNNASIIPDKWEGFPGAIELIRRDKLRYSV